MEFNSFQFILSLANLASSLSSLLDEQIIPHLRMGSMVGRKINELQYLYNQHKYEELEWSFTLLSILNNELININKKDPALLKKLVILHKAYSNNQRANKVNLVQYNQNTEDKYYGFRCEVHVASQLLINNINFIKRETPDFEIKFKDTQLKLECTSAHLHPFNQDTNKLDKILETLRKKLANSQYDHKTAIIIDITNIMHFFEKRKTLPSEEELKSLVSLETLNYRVGAVLLYLYIVDKNKNIVTPVYIPVENSKKYPILKSLLELIFPKGHNPLVNYTIPKSF